MQLTRWTAVAVATLSLAALTACSAATASPSTSGGTENGTAGEGFPLTIENAFGATTIPEKPERVVTIDWGNQDVALALGIVPVAMPKVTYGDEDGDGLLPWAKDKLDELGAETPVLMDETDGYDYEAIADAQPDVILAAYSGMTAEQYETLSKIAPVVTYQGVAWGTTWQDMTRLDGTALGLKDEAEALIGDLEQHVAETAAAYPALAAKTTLLSYFDPNDLSSIGFYTLADPRAVYLEELGLTPAAYVAEQSAASDEFWITTSTEQIESFADLQVLVTYGTEDTVSQMQADPLLSRIPAVSSGAIATILANSTMSAAINPTPLSIGTTYGDDYIALIGEAATKAS